mgnify:CR=1 FL=1|tara:strand:- start:2333 stop:2527 length:195 start_codon:yes stop_codon:yes gene_type:complete
MWTCCECENHYDSNTGDTDERMCHECMDAQYEGWIKESVMGGTKKTVDNFFGYLDTILKDRNKS